MRPRQTSWLTAGILTCAAPLAASHVHPAAQLRPAGPTPQATSAVAASDLAGALLVATLTPQGSASTGGAGSASLSLDGDVVVATLRYSHGGLSGPLTAAHIHGPGGAILFDLDTATPQADGSLLWRLVPTGTFDVAEIHAALRAGDCFLNLHTAAYPAGEISGFFRRVHGSRTFTPPPLPPALPAGPTSDEEAARFLMQATYGPRLDAIGALRRQGFAGWIDAQLAQPHESFLAEYDGLLAAGDVPRPALVREPLLRCAVQGEDQLRQRMVFALSELFVVSDRDAALRNNPDSMAAYLDVLATHAFGSFRGLLEAVTLSPAMGAYLDMAGSSRALPDYGRLPNENYAREVLQLFSIGLHQLHPDGTLRLDEHDQPIPTYGQQEVLAFARAFTGWTLGGQRRGNPLRFFRPQRNFRVPMESWELFHDRGEKRLLDGRTLVAGRSARADLEAALDDVFAHPNVGPFVCRFLIQRLVTSNPGPGAVYRCAQAFADDGGGERGDLGAVLRAILLDYEARAPELVTRQDQGHLREPFVRLVSLLRVLDAEPQRGRWRLPPLDQPGLSLGQVPLRAPTVFNFFAPDYALPGEIAQAGLLSPELQIATETTLVGGANLHAMLLAAAGRGEVLRSDLSPFLPPLVRGDRALLDRVDLLLFAGSMSPPTRQALERALADPGFPRERRGRVLTLLWLASLSPESAVQK